MIDRWFGNDGDVQSGDQDINTLTSLVVFIYNHNSHAHTHTSAAHSHTAQLQVSDLCQCEDSRHGRTWSWSLSWLWLMDSLKLFSMKKSCFFLSSCLSFVSNIHQSLTHEPRVNMKLNSICNQSRPSWRLDHLWLTICHINDH